MPRDSAKRTQGDLFGEPEPQAPRYVPKREHVLSGCRLVLEQLRALADWRGASKWEIERLGKSNPAYYCGLLADPSEREEWRAKFAAEVARLDKATPAGLLPPAP
jgi:hypothetical protein